MDTGKEAAMSSGATTATSQKQDTQQSQNGTQPAEPPKGETKPLEGKVELDDDAGYVAELVAYQALKERAKPIAKRINDTQLYPAGVTEAHAGFKAKILIVDTLDLVQHFVPPVQLEAQFAVFEDRIRERITANHGVMRGVEPRAERMLVPSLGVSSIPSVPGSVTATLSLLADIMGYFKTDVSMKGRKVEIKSQVLGPIIAERITNHDTFISNFRWLAESAILTRFAALRQQRDELVATRDQLANIAIELDGHADHAQQDRVEHIQQALTASKALIEEFDAFSMAITQVGEGQQMPLLAFAAVADQVQQLGITHFLYLGVVSSGGEVITKRQIFFLTPKVAFLGGAVYSYVLADTSGKVILADMVSVLAEMVYNFSSDPAQIPTLREIFGG
jgi:hypothetical protein